MLYLLDLGALSGLFGGSKGDKNNILKNVKDIIRYGSSWLLKLNLLPKVKFQKCWIYTAVMMITCVRNYVYWLFLFRVKLKGIMNKVRIDYLVLVLHRTIHVLWVHYTLTMNRIKTMRNGIKCYFLWAKHILYCKSVFKVLIVHTAKFSINLILQV